MIAIVLGSAAGGGFPQWNSNAEACRRARSGDPLVQRRTQASLAVSADGADWYLLNASPDLGWQIALTPALHPRTGLRSSPIAGVVLTGGDVDAIAGLLTLRERHAFTIYATRHLHQIINANPIFSVLSAELVTRTAMVPGERTDLALPGAEGGKLYVEVIAIPGKIPLYLEQTGAEPPIVTDEVTVGIIVSDGLRTLAYIPGCESVTNELLSRLDDVDMLFFDGTLWSDNEMIAGGLGNKTGRRMGHISISGPDGAMAALASVKARRKVFIHINNSNPILIEDSPERAEVMAAGWEVAYDGMELRL
jgi:pyrroloquinoline quinone biosynthesis protein B